MPFWKDSKKGKKDEIVSTSKSLVVSRSNGDIQQSSSMSYTRQESIISKTTEIRSVSIQQSGTTTSFAASQNSLNSTGSNTSSQKLGSSVKSSIFDVKPISSQLATDGTPVNLVSGYKRSPARSAFNAAPLTVRTPTSSNSSYQSVYGNSRPTNTSSNFVLNTPVATQIQNPRINPSGFINSNTTNNNNHEFRNKLTVKTLKSTKFYDNQSKVPTYTTRSKNRGKLLLINNIKFANDNNKIRKGAELDEENISQLFKQIGFDIVKWRNLTKKDMQNKIINFRKSNLRKYDIGAVIVMSHGTGKERSDSTEIACTDGELLQTTWIINEFDSKSCPDLSGKPKIFLFQCCRGDNKDIEHDAALVTPPRKLCDMLIAYSTVPGFVSHRDPSTGSWYIQAICKVFMEHAHDTDVESLLKIVDGKLADLVADGSKQTSSFENRGFKTCYLHPMLHE